MYIHREYRYYVRERLLHEKIIAILQAAGEAGLEVVGVKEGALLCLR